MTVNRIASVRPEVTNGITLPNNALRLSEQVYESLVEMIVLGKLEPGRPVSEVELARLMNVSRTPIHEAVKQLAKDGLIVQSANRRPVVVSFGSDDIRDIYEMRIILESEAAAKSANRMDLPTLQRLEEALNQFRKIRPSESMIATWVQMDDEFHSAIANASGSPRLKLDINRYRLLHRVFNRSHSDPSVLLQAAEEHSAILEAFRKRSADLARKSMRRHLEEWQRFFANHLR